MIIIGFGHRSRTGKDTAADYLCDKFVKEAFKGRSIPYICVKMSFAGELKRHCRKLFPKLRTAAYYNEHPEFRTVMLPEYGLTPVEIWVEVGTFMRAIYPNVWVDLVRKKLKRIGFHRPNVVIVISDVRAENEVDFIHEFENGICIKIEKPGVSDQPGADFDNILSDYKGWDQTIVNIHGKKDEFLEEVATMTHTFITKGDLK